MYGPMTDSQREARADFTRAVWKLVEQARQAGLPDERISERLFDICSDVRVEAELAEREARSSVND